MVTIGDHAFVVIDRNLASDPNKPSMWGEKAIIADGLAGKVYPAQQLSLHLKGYWRYKESKFMPKRNVCVEYNSKFHKLSSIGVFQHKKVPRGTINSTSSL